MDKEFDGFRMQQPVIDQDPRLEPRLQLTEVAIANENRQFRGTGGRSQENRASGFHPAFLDAQTQAIYDSRFPDGRPAPFHMIDGLPEEVVVARHPSGRVAGVKPSVVSGFVREGRFYTREEAACCMASETKH